MPLSALPLCPTGRVGSSDPYSLRRLQRPENFSQCAQSTNNEDELSSFMCCLLSPKTPHKCEFLIVTPLNVTAHCLRETETNVHCMPVSVIIRRRLVNGNGEFLPRQKKNRNTPFRWIYCNKTWLTLQIP